MFRAYDSPKRIFDLLREVKLLAREYYELTERPLGVTREIAEYEAARILKVKLSAPRQSGFDAIRKKSGKEERLQIKGGADLLPNRRQASALEASTLFMKEWDVVLLVLLNERYEPTEISEADRRAVTAALTKPGSKARNERGSLAVNQFKSIGSRIWPE